MHRSEEIFRSTFEQAAVGLAHVAPDGRWLRVNKHLCDLVGYSPKELLATTPKAITHPDDQPTVSNYVRRLICGEIATFSMEKRYIHKDGSPVWVNLTVSPVRDASGDIVCYAAVIQDIRDRKRFEEALQQSEERLNLILEATSEGVWDWNVKTGEVYFSPRWIESLGYSPEEVPPHVSFWESIVHAEDMPRVQLQLQAHFAGHTPDYQCENRLRMKSGQWRWNLDQGKVVEWDKDGKPVRMIGTDIDITERKQAELAQRESEERLRLMADSLPVLICYVDAQCRYQFNNAAYEHWFGVPRETFKDCYLWEALGQPVYDIIKEHVTEVLAGKPVAFESQVPYKGAGTRDVYINYVPHRDTAGKVAGFYALILDVTERRRADQALRESEERLAAIHSAAADAIITIDDRGIIESFNPAAESIFGYPADEIIGQNVSILMPSPFREEHDEYIRRYLQTGQKRIIGTVREVTGRRKDGTILSMDLAVSEVKVGSKRLFTGIHRDISSRKELEKEILEIASQEQRRIGQDLHDNTGQELTGLVFLAETLAEKLTEVGSAEVELARKITARIRRVLSQVRALSRGLVPVEVDAGGLMAALTDLAKRISDLHHVDCTFTYDAPVSIEDNQVANHLYRIAQEAITNALKHGQAEHIRVKLTAEKDLIALTIRDDGSGITETAKESTGMGMRIMAYRADLIGASLNIAAAPEGGTLVTCILSTSFYHGKKHTQPRKESSPDSHRR